MTVRRGPPIIEAPEGPLPGARRVVPVARSARPSEPACYRIRVRGHIPYHVGSLFSGITVQACPAQGSDVAELRGVVADQTALHSLLQYLYDADLILLSLEEIGASPRVDPAIG